ncbi:putative hydrolase of the HAD superfamily [Devosia lucknowensis]|uniref:Putative hydrolase of the HAD superfamily n=1 Tax=Devosia lucknowensis TaxID=1096929 RepID=A0A1Y6EK61_9HYPH|nr:HAD family hydrolase [Devosia lucknowensis]SMQ63048.1 putative hydrolase of the HAD superfamily [Devosia lucknowensis]
MTEVLQHADADLAALYAPHLMFDTNEPYLPHALGYTIFRIAGLSPSSKFAIEPLGALTIEYAIYYDWDIGHLYDLEHVWVHVGAMGEILRVEASSHGGCKVMDIGEGLPEFSSPQVFRRPSSLPGLSGHPVLYVEAGKHAHWASPAHMTEADRQKLAVLCGPLAGIEGVHLGNPFAKRGAYTARPRDHRLARLKMTTDAFEPGHSYRASSTEVPLLPWPDLEAIIPQRITDIMTRLETDQPHFAAIFLDCGDTLIDERTEEKLPGSEVVIRADLIPGAKEMMDSLKAAGHKLILVADGPRQTFVNMLTHHGLWDHFDAHIISEDVGVHKPDVRMFDAALAAAGLTRDDAWRTVMVGNNLSRDICGANALGMTSIFMAWSTLRTHEPANPSEVPDYRIDSPSELPALLDVLEMLTKYRCRPFQR